MKLAIVHDYLNQFGGAERVVEVLSEIFPQAPIYTSIYLPENMPDSFRKMDIHTSFMQNLPFLNKHFKKYLLLYPYAFKYFGLSEYDVILSSSSAWAKGAKAAPGSCHICYCYTPMRWVWKYEDYVARENFSMATRKILPLAIERLRRWDLATNKGVNYFIAISKYVAERIKRCYGKESVVIYPPVNTSLYQSVLQTGDYYLIVSRLNTYKKIDMAIEAFNKLKLPLRIAGAGPYQDTLKQMAGPTIKFLGKLLDEDLIKQYGECKALIFPGEEDFGIAPVEAQAAGKPVIAFGSGGALETIVEGKTGIFFKEQTPNGLIQAVHKFEKTFFDSNEIKEHAKTFDKKIFKDKIKKFITEKYQQNLTNLI